MALLVMQGQLIKRCELALDGIAGSASTVDQIVVNGVAGDASTIIKCLIIVNGIASNANTDKQTNKENIQVQRRRLRPKCACRHRHVCPPG